MESELLNLPLGVKIPVAPGTKPVFSRGKLGEKVKEVGRGRKSLIFHRVPHHAKIFLQPLDLQQELQPFNWRQDWTREAPGSLKCRGESTCPSSHYFLALCMCVAKSLPAAGSCVCPSARAMSPSTPSHNVKPGPGAPVKEIPTFSSLSSQNL